ncbi:hypothetical protein KY285_036251 [Solanum tuberosum]|nr:hypothetical protein KY285_036251 [Solanum tuberosum]
MGRRGRIPTQKAVEAQEIIASKSNEKVKTKANETVSSPKSILKEWNEAIYSPNISARKSWANEMESENEGQIPVCEIDLEDITSEIDYWKNAVVCYVLGAHPPFAVLNGYIQRQWGKFGINNVSMLKNRIVLVSMLNPERKDQIDGEKEQSACPRAISRSSTMSPNDPKHDNVEG